VYQQPKGTTLSAMGPEIYRAVMRSWAGPHYTCALRSCKLTVEGYEGGSIFARLPIRGYGHHRPSTTAAARRVPQAGDSQQGGASILPVTELARFASGMGVTGVTLGNSYEEVGNRYYSSASGKCSGVVYEESVHDTTLLHFSSVGPACGGGDD